jgi:hypothetical protein
VTDATCIHEATHASVALHLGLVVREVRVKGWTKVPRYCAQLYPGIIRGMPIRTPVTLLEEDCLDTHPFEVLIAMAAPSFVVTDDRKINRYAGLEAMLAYRYADKHGIPSIRVQARAQRISAAVEPDIYDMALRLEREGVLTAEMLAERHLDPFQQARADHSRGVQR